MNHVVARLGPGPAWPYHVLPGKSGRAKFEQALAAYCARTPGLKAERKSFDRVGHLCVQTLVPLKLWMLAGEAMFRRNTPRRVMLERIMVIHATLILREGHL